MRVCISIVRHLAPLTLAFAAGAVAAPAAGIAASEPRTAELIPVAPKATLDRPDFTAHAVVLRDGALLAIYERPGSGPALVLIPETNGDRAQFFSDAFLQAINPRLRLIVIETRGQGRSWPPPAPAQATIEYYADDVLEVARRFAGANWYVSGHSLGGMIVIEVGDRRPAGLRGVIPLEGWAHSRVPAQAFPNEPRLSPEQSAEARRQREARYLSHRWTAAEYASLTGMWRAWTRGETILRETTLPFLHVFGDRGRAGRPDRAQLLVPDRSGMKVAWIAGAGHHLLLPPHAGEVAQAINGFIAQVEGGAMPR
jgi:pimeloyl-ACP methyl ester carboxylesterase